MPPSATTNPKADALNRPAYCQPAAAAGNSNLPPPDALKRKPSAGILTTSTSAAGKRTARLTTTTGTAFAATAAPANSIATSTANANATLTTPHASRHPLRLRDQNATPALRAVKPGPAPTPLPVITVTRMPSYERSAAVNQRQPTVARVNKPPLTPKIAARTAASHHQTPTLATTPLARRTAAPDSTLTANGPASRDRDDVTSPVSAFLSSNITPRSGSRQNRVDSASSTPTGTPNPDRHEPWDTRPATGYGTDESRDSKFFYASDAQKPTPQPANSRPSSLQQPKPPTFFYAKGTPVLERQAAPSAPVPPPLASPTLQQDNLMSKFMYANGAPELQPPAKIGPSTQTPGPVGSTAPKLPTCRPGNVPRAESPVKSPQQHVAPKNTTSTLISPRSSISGPQTSHDPSQEKAHVEAAPRPKLTHSRTASATFVELPIPLKRASTHASIGSTTFAEPPVPTKRVSIHASLPSSGSASPSHPPNPSLTLPTNPPHPGPTLPSNPATSGFASLLQAAEEFAEPEEEAQPDSLNSPTKTTPDDPATSLVANARRERKVQDLQITNASLEAINRTLERQLRKQTAELRRYQRLSRSGRLSLGSVGSRIPSDSTVDGGGLARAGMGLDDLSEEESEIEAEDAELDEELDEADDDEEDGLSGSEASGERSPRANALRQEKRRGDERRLQLDLSKHQQLLVDSQKINQSLKRCLGWTEELIKEGKRALAYHVRPSDVELGGRVLAPEEVERRERAKSEAEENGGNNSNGLDEDTIYAIDALGRGDLSDAETSTSFGKDVDDRDSGIELPADGEEELRHV